VVDWLILIINWHNFIFIGATRRLQDQNIPLRYVLNKSNLVYVYDNFHEELLQSLTFLSTDVTISGGGLVNSDYQLAQFHFHWGDSSSSGSEHTIDNNYAPLEVCIKFQTVGYNFDVRGLIPGTIWKMSCHNLFITYFTWTFFKH
jgi:hypothetical protein